MRIDFTFAPEITDEVILKAFEGTNFGRNDYREFLAYSVLQKACGWHCGFTITSIMIALKLITPEHHRVTKLGRMFLSDCYNDPMRNQPVSQPYKLPDGFVAVPRALTAENGAKAVLMGEFNLEYNLVCHECFGEGCDDCSGEGRWINSIPVDWTTIKEIWRRGIEHFTPPTDSTT